MHKFHKFSKISTRIYYIKVARVLLRIADTRMGIGCVRVSTSQGKMAWTHAHTDGEDLSRTHINAENRPAGRMASPKECE